MAKSIQIPDGWNYGRIDQFFELQRGFDLTQAQSTPGDVPVISSSGISYYHNIAKVQPPGVITGRKGSLGKVFYVDIPFWPHDTSLWVKDFKGNDPRFVQIFLQSLGLEDFDAATSVPTLNRNNVHSLLTLFPPLPEQRAIAAILSTWDEAITLTEALIEALRHRKQALMQLLLTGKIRFQEFEGSEWEEVELRDVVRSFSGGTPSRARPEYFGGEIPWIKSGEINQVNITSTEETITEQGLQASSTKIVEKDTVLVALYGATAGKVGVTRIRAAINQALLALVPKADVLDRNYLFYELQNQMSDILRKLQGGQPNLSAQLVTESYISLPGIEEQSKIALVMQIADEEINSFKELREYLQTQKRALMQQLLTGAIRVKSL